MIVIKNKTLRQVLSIITPFILIPCIIAVGVFVLDEKYYALVTTAVAVLALVYFITGFERKQTGTRRLIIIAVMVALSVAGRFIPFFKPITALTVITAVYLGGEAGFLTGALAALISNFYFGQGPWTPFQMFAWGIIGLVAGLLSTPLKKSRLLTVLYGVISGVAFSLIMDIWAVLGHSGTLNTQLYLASVISALPHTVLYAVSNAVFLWICAKPFGEKLQRVKLKYGV